MYRLLVALCIVALVASQDASRTTGAAQAQKQQNANEHAGTGGVRGARQQGVSSSLVPNNGSIVATSSEIYLPSTGTFSSVDTNKAIIAGVLSVGLLTICFLGLAVLVCYISWKTGGTVQGTGASQMVNLEKKEAVFTTDSPLFKPLITENDNPLFQSQRT